MYNMKISILSAFNFNQFYLEFYEKKNFQDNILFGSGGSTLVWPNLG